MPIAFVFFLLASTLPILGASDIPTTLTTSSLTLTVAPAISRPFNEVSVADIATHKIRLIGSLGKDIGTRALVRFTTSQSKPFGGFDISITEVDGTKLTKPVTLSFVDKQVERENYKKIPITALKREYLAIGYEIAEYASVPEWSWKDSDINPHPKESDGPSIALRLSSHFVVVKILEAKEVSSQ